jgi:hypothetical protein
MSCGNSTRCSSRCHVYSGNKNDRAATLPRNSDVLYSRRDSALAIRAKKLPSAPNSPLRVSLTCTFGWRKSPQRYAWSVVWRTGKCNLQCRRSSMSVSNTSATPAVLRGRVVRIQRQQEPATCVLANQSKILLSRFLSGYVSVGDDLTFPVPDGDAVGAEILITKNAPSGPHTVYQVPIGYVTQPKTDKRNERFVAAEIRKPGLGVESVFLPCEALREYFFRLPQRDQREGGTLYDPLRIPANASPAELRVAFKLRDLELNAAGASRREHVALERAFNIVGQPELRAAYDALLADSDAAAVFPYGGFGSLLVAGEPSRDGQTFFAHRILAFLPEHRRRRFHLPLRKCEFYEALALCRDVQRKLEIWLDPALLHANWDPTWNQWKRFLGAKIEVDATFVRSGKYRKRRGEWQLDTWEMALPSRIAIKLPVDFQRQIESAKGISHRYGQYTTAFEQIRLRLEYHAMEKRELDTMCFALRLPGDLDLAQINWRPDYDPFFYEQLSCRARRTYLFRDEYIFDLERAVIVETPQLGHATYLFAKPRSMETFLAIYTKTRKDDIRRNRDNVAERLKFLGRVIHGTNPRAWLDEIRQRIGEAADPSLCPRNNGEAHSL